MSGKNSFSVLEKSSTLCICVSSFAKVDQVHLSYHEIKIQLPIHHVWVKMSSCFQIPAPSLDLS